MKIGLKYCGGCNPNHERSAIARRAQRDYPSVLFEPYSPSAAYDLVLVICGCMEECFSFPCENSGHGAVWVRSPEEYSAFRRAMGALTDHRLIQNRERKDG